MTRVGAIGKKFGGGAQAPMTSRQAASSPGRSGRAWTLKRRSPPSVHLVFWLAAPSSASHAAASLRGVRHPGPAAEVSRVGATDPLNLVGMLSPGPRVPAIVGNAVLYVDGQAVASIEGGELVHRAPLPQGARIDDDLTYHPPPRPHTAASQAALPL